MKITDEIRECFDTEMGVPTFTVELPKEERMFPYSSFRNAAYQGGRITIELYDWEIAITGKCMSSLWKHLQLQDVRVIRSNSDDIDGECVVSSIEVKRLEELPEQQEL